MTVTIANGGNQGNRRELDYYPTQPDVTKALLDFLKLDYSNIWEPACGEGHMSEVIKSYGHSVISTDLRHTGYGIGGVDFLTCNRLSCDAIITNPPFNISEQFIIKSLQTSPIVAMLLKSQYWHAKKRYKLFLEYPPAWVLPLTWRPDFLFDQRENGVKGAPTMECLWTVWFPNEVNTRYQPLLKP